MSSSAFLPPPPLHLCTSDILLRPADRISYRLRLRHRPSKHPPARQTPRAAWEDCVPPPLSPAQQLSTLHSLHPTQSSHLQLCALNPGASLAYATASSLSSSLPIPCESRSDVELVRDTLAFIQALACPNSVSLIDASVLARVLDGIKNGLRIDHVRCNTLTARVREVCGVRVSRLEIILCVLRELNLRVLAAELVDVETVATSVCLQGGLYVVEGRGDDLGTWGVGIGLWEEGRGEVTRVPCTPAVAICVAHGVGVDCFVQRDLYEMVAVRNADRERIIASTTENAQGEDRINLPFVIPWELTAEDVIRLSDSTLQNTLTRYNIATRALENRADLLRKFVKLMDETERRELGILLSAEQGRYGLAAELQRGRSKRGVVLNELKEAEERGEWNTVMKLGEHLRHLENGVMDITAEPGSYGGLLDRDEWYRPNR